MSLNATTSNGPLVKILFRLAPDSKSGSVAETMWAYDLGASVYRLNSIPFHVRGVSFQDVVSACDDDGMPAFDCVIKRSGHSTYRLFKARQWEAGFSSEWNKLSECGCRYECCGNGYAVDVPPESDFDVAYGYLKAGASKGIWKLEELHCGHPSKKRK